MRLQMLLLAASVALVTVPTSVNAQDGVAPAAMPAPEAPPPVVAPAPVKPATPVKPPVAAPKKKFSDGLKPGQFVWETRAHKATELKIVAVLDIQRIYVFDKGELVAFSTISSGKKGHATPPGTFKILQKNETHFSNLYNNAPMPFMQRLTWDGIALHAGQIPGYPASHGCIRLPMAFAKALFGVTKMDQTVIVLSDLNSVAPPPEETPAAPAGSEAGVVKPPAPEAGPATPPVTDAVPPEPVEPTN
jgi:lipoprotein-anchoring transpeptidase ErfK/SrfK